MLSGGLLALDLNPTRCGVAVGGETDAAPHLISWQMHGKETEADLGRTCAALYRSISDLCKLMHPRWMIYEAPILGGPGGAYSVRGQMSVSAVAMAAGINSGAQIEPANIQSWRKHFLGNGFPEDPKQCALDQCAAYGWKPKNHDEADAAGIWHFGMSKHFKGIAVPCSPLFARVRA